MKAARTAAWVVKILAFGLVLQCQEELSLLLGGGDRRIIGLLFFRGVPAGTTLPGLCRPLLHRQLLFSGLLHRQLLYRDLGLLYAATAG
jgi:hypothetical protein